MSSVCSRHQDQSADCEICNSVVEFNNVQRSRVMRANWIKFDSVKPPHNKYIFVCFKNKQGYVWRTIAVYIAPRKILAQDFLNEDACDDQSFVDYDSENDCDWTPSGFYEFSYEGEDSFFLSHEVTHWMPLPDKPSDV